LASEIHIQYKKTYIIIMIHIQYKNIQLLSANTDTHSYDSSYPLPIYHTSTEVKYLYTFNINHTHMVFHSIHLAISLCPHLHRK